MTAEIDRPISTHRTRSRPPIGRVRQRSRRGVQPHPPPVAAVEPYHVLSPAELQAARDRALQRVGDRIRTVLMDADPQVHNWQAIDPVYQELEAKYRLAEEGYERWPFGRSAFGGVSITAGLTLIANIAAIVYRLSGS